MSPRQRLHAFRRLEFRRLELRRLKLELLEATLRRGIIAERGHRTDAVAWHHDQLLVGGCALV